MFNPGCSIKTIPPCTVINTHAPSIVQAVQELLTEVQLLQTALLSLNLVLNIHKTKFIVLSNAHLQLPDDSRNFKTNGNSIEWVPE